MGTFYSLRFSPSIWGFLSDHWYATWFLSMMLLLVFRSFEIAAIWFPKQTHTTHIHRRPACGQHEASQNLKRPEIGDAWFRLKCFILVSVVVLQKFVCLLWLCHYTFRSNDIFTVVKVFALTPHHISSFHRTALLCSGCCVFTYSVDLFIEVCIWEVRNCIFQTTSTKTEKHREREKKNSSTWSRSVQTFDLTTKQWFYKTMVLGSTRPQTKMN